MTKLNIIAIVAVGLCGIAGLALAVLSSMSLDKVAVGVGLFGLLLTYSARLIARKN